MKLNTDTKLKKYIGGKVPVVWRDDRGRAILYLYSHNSNALTEEEKTNLYNNLSESFSILLQDHSK